MDGHFCHASLWMFSAALLWCSIYLLSHDCAKQNFLLRQKMMTCIHMAKNHPRFSEDFLPFCGSHNNTVEVHFFRTVTYSSKYHPIWRSDSLSKNEQKKRVGYNPSQNAFGAVFLLSQIFICTFFVLCLGLSSALITTFRRITSFLSLAQNSVGDLQGFLCVLYIIVQEFSFIQIRSPPHMTILWLNKDGPWK